MRLVSYNVRYFGHALKGLASTRNVKRGIARALASLDPLPDLIALQEVESRSIRSAALARSHHPHETQLEAFMRHFDEALSAVGVAQPYRALYYPAHAYQLGPIKFYTTGLACLVNAQTLEVRGHNASAPQRITHVVSARLQTIKQTRIAAHVELETLQGKRFHLFNTHLSLPTAWVKEFWAQREKMGHGANQLAEARAVADFAKRTAGQNPYLVVGDFNSAPSSPVFEFLRGEAGLECAQESLGQLDGRSPRAYPTAGFAALRMHLDHIFGGQGLRFIDLQGTSPFGDALSPFHGLSDHVPLICRFDVP